MADDNVMPAKAATQIQVNAKVIRWNRSVCTTSGGCSAAANSRTNGLPISTPTRATRNIPALLSGWIQRDMNDSLSAKVRTASTTNVATAPISSVCPGFLVVRPIANTATAISNAIATAVPNGTLPTSTQ